MKKAWMLFLLLTWIVFFSGCGDDSPVVPGVDSSEGGTTPRSSGIMENTELDAITFVDIDFDAFPTLPENIIPESGVIYIAKNGNDSTGNGSEASPYLTIVKGIHEAVAGDTIVVRQGVYAEEAEAGDYRGIIIQTNNITLMGYPGETVEIIPANDTVTYGIIVQSDNLVIRGLTIKDFPRICIQLYKDVLRNLVLADLKIANSRQGISSPHHKVDGALIYNVDISGIEFIGLDCGTDRATNWRVENTTIAMDSGGSGSGADAFAIEDGDNILLVNTEVSGATADGIDTKATRVFIYGCYVHDIGRNGIKLWHGGDIVNTLVHHTGADAAVVVSEGAKTRLLHTVVAYHNYNGGESYNITFGYGTHPDSIYEITNSIIYNTSGGAYFSPNSTLSINNSLFYGMENGTVLTHAGATVYLSEGAEGLNQYGSGNMMKDPQLDNYFYPIEGSPVINAGVVLQEGYPSADSNGDIRVQNTSPDLGPFETLW